MGRSVSVGSWLILLGLAPGCSAELLDPAVDPGEFALIQPEVVAYATSLKAIPVTTADADDENPAYAGVGVHLGHGLVVSLDGDLVAVPQLLATTSADLAIAQPAAVDIGSVGNRELLRTEDGYRARGLAGTARFLTTTESGIEGRWRKGQNRPSLSIDFDGETTTVSRWGRPRLVVQSQGDHLLVQSVQIANRVRVVHDGPDGFYEVARDQWPKSVWTATTEAGETIIQGPTNRWTYFRDVGEDGLEEMVREAWWGRNRTTVSSDGWVERDGVVRTTVRVDGGRALLVE